MKGAALLLALAACAPAPEGPAGPAGDWRLETLDGAALVGTATLHLAPGGGLSGEGPCNAYTGRNAATPPDFRLAGFTATRRQCLIEGGEQAFFRALAGAGRIELASGRLRLSGPGGEAVFAPE